MKMDDLEQLKLENERLRREVEDLRDFVKGISTNIIKMLKDPARENTD